jgi:hypothetical protein
VALAPCSEGSAERSVVKEQQAVEWRDATLAEQERVIGRLHSLLAEERAKHSSGGASGDSPQDPTSSRWLHNPAFCAWTFTLDTLPYKTLTSMHNIRYGTQTNSRIQPDFSTLSVRT